MNASLAVPTPTAVAAPATKPSFVGLVRGELLKLSRQWMLWIMVVLLAGIIFLPYLVAIASPKNIKLELQAAPLLTMYEWMGTVLLVLRIFSGTFLILLTARLIGMEYSSGTIRILLARGVGRLQLLAVKLTTIALVALAVLVVGLLFNALLSLIALNAIQGNLDALKVLNSAFWDDTRLYVGLIAISMTATVLMTTAFTVLGRSLAVGMSAGLSFFAVDNIGVIFFYLAYRLTGSNFWTLATGDLLGPNINAMPGALLPARAAGAQMTGVLATPFVPVDGGHTLLVTAIWTVAFAVVAVGLTWKRDVTQ